MKNLLEFLVNFCLPLFERYQVKFKDSGTGRHSACGAWVLLDSRHVQIYISNERNEITFEMRSTYDSNKKNWFSFDLVMKLIGQDIRTGVMDENNAKLLIKNIDKIMSRFEEHVAKDTIEKMTKLKANRVKGV
jgi:hypothetical protein